MVSRFLFGTLLAAGLAVVPGLLHAEAFGPPGVQPAGGDASATVTTATGSTTARTLAARAASVVDVRDFGARCDGVTDDTAAFSASVARINFVFANGGTMPRIYIPAGRCYIASAITQFSVNVPGGVVGEGPDRSFIVVGASFTGSVFSWDEAWGLTPLSSGTYPASPASGWNGASVSGVSFVGTLPATNTQHALTFYDRNDFALIKDVSIYYFNGSGISIGTTKIQPQAYMRESKFYNVRVWASGNATYPAISIGSVGTSGSDATNEVSVFGLDIISSNGKSLVINNSNSTMPVRLLRIYGLRLESGTDDLLTIGDPTLTGAVSNVQIFGLEENAIASGKIGVHLTAPALASAPTDVSITGMVGSGVGKGVVLDSAGSVTLNLSIQSTDTNLTVGPSTLVKGPIYANGNGAEYLWSTAIDSTSANLVRLPSLRFGALGGNASLVANAHDGTPGRGNAIPAGSIDLQSQRFSASQVASGAFSVIGGGLNNTATAADSVVVGGNTNTSNGFIGFLGGGNANIIGGGTGNVLAGGQNNLVQGNYSSILGGLYGTDRSRYGWYGYSAGRITTAGDAQTGAQILRGSTAVATALRLTADQAAAGATNTVNIPVGTHYHARVSASCRDVTTGGWATWDALGGDLDRAASATVTYAGGYAVATAPTRSSGALSAMTLTISGDSTNEGASVSIAPPSSNTDTIHCGSLIETAEEIQ